MLGTSREDGNAYLVCKRNWIWKDHFIESVTQNWRYFRFSPISVVSPLQRVLSSIQAGRRGMFICSKLRQNLSEIKVRTFIRIKRVTWDHLLAFNGEIIQKQALFPFHVLNNNYRVVYAVCHVFSFVLS